MAHVGIERGDESRLSPWMLGGSLFFSHWMVACHSDCCVVFNMPTGHWTNKKALEEDIFSCHGNETWLGDAFSWTPCGGEKRICQMLCVCFCHENGNHDVRLYRSNWRFARFRHFWEMMTQYWVFGKQVTTDPYLNLFGIRQACQSQRLTRAK